MFDKELALDSLHTIASALQLIVERASVVSTPDDFLCSPDGMLRLDAICMNLIALGKITHGDFLPHYPEIYWSGVMRMRDKIAHHYFEIDAEVVFNTIEEDIPQMISVIRRMIKELE